MTGLDRSPRTVARTLGMLGLLTAVAPLNLLVTGTVLVRRAVVRPPRAVAARPRTILVSGGKMTKALQLARGFHAAGHRVVLVEQARYRLTGHRFSRAVDAFHVVPAPTDDTYPQALLDVVLREGVDTYVPVCSPVASYHDARAKAVLAPHCEVVHLDPDALRRVDDKDSFAELAASLGLRVPETHRITDPAQVVAFDFGARAGTPFILKSIGYDPVRRMDLTPLPRPTAAQTRAFAEALPISEANPWILQELVRGREYCTHGTVRDGELQVYACCESSAFQINYAHVDVPAIEAWVRTFARGLGGTGQLSFDFLVGEDGDPVAIECNPRTHSAITLFADHPDLARGYLEDGVATLVPTPHTRPTYWLYHEVWRLLTKPGRGHRLRTILTGRDAVLDLADPVPFLALHHLHVPWLLLQNLWAGTGWVKIDFNIGKLVEPGGD